MVQPAAPAPGPSGLEPPPPRSHPHSFPKGGARGPRSPPGRHWWYGPARHRGGSRRDHRGGGRAFGDTHWCAHLSPAAAQPLRRGSTPAHHHAALAPALEFPGGSGGGGSGNAFSEPGPTACTARPPRPLPQPPLTAPSHPLDGNTAFSRNNRN